MEKLNLKLSELINFWKKKQFSKISITLASSDLSDKQIQQRFDCQICKNISIIPVLTCSACSHFYCLHPCLSSKTNILIKDKKDKDPIDLL